MRLNTNAGHLALRVVAALIASLIPGMAAADAERPGVGVYEAVCAACHGRGVPRAPQLGDRRQWARLIREGQAALTAQAWVGIRGMPPQGGRADLSLESFAGGVAYMAQRAGADWQPPDPALLERIESEVRKREARRKAKSCQGY